MDLPFSRQFETERTRRFRDSALSEADEKTIATIEEHGCQIVQITGDDVCPRWSYTLGVYDNCSKPELIVIGLREQTAKYLLNEAARRLRVGIDLTQGRHTEMIGSVECEFRPVAAKWVRRVMPWATWFYGDSEFPVLQAIYPDLENRFPHEPDFNSDYRFPLLQSDAPESISETDFWAANDPNSSLWDWKFPDLPHTQAFLSKPVHAGLEAVTYVSHDVEDGAWQFLGDSMTGGDKPVVSCLHHPIDKDPALNELADLPRGWWAERSKPGEPWVRHSD